MKKKEIKNRTRKELQKNRKQNKSIVRRKFMVRLRENGIHLQRLQKKYNILYLRISIIIINRIIKMFHGSNAGLFTKIYGIDLIDNINTKCNNMEYVNGLYFTDNTDIFKFNRRGIFDYGEYSVSIYMVLFFIENKTIFERLKKSEEYIKKTLKVKSIEKKRKNNFIQRIKKIEKESGKKILDNDGNFI